MGNSQRWGRGESCARGLLPVARPLVPAEHWPVAYVLRCFASPCGYGRGLGECAQSYLALGLWLPLLSPVLHLWKGKNWTLTRHEVREQTHRSHWAQV